MEHIRGSGPGGQHRNKNSTGVRLTHRASGARGEATDSKSQEQNKANAFKRLRETPEWKRWFNDAYQQAMGLESLESKLQRALEQPITTRVRQNDRWVTVDPDTLVDNS